MRQIGKTAVAAIAVTFALMVIASVASWEVEEDTGHHLWLHQLKKTFCASIQSYRIYKVENLEVHCAGKVGFFEDRVSENISF